jgi:hypothetical protein
MVALSLGEAPAEAWDALIARAETSNPQVQERMELLEVRAIGEAARGQIDLALRHLQQALSLGSGQLLARRIAARIQSLARTDAGG